MRRLSVALLLVLSLVVMGLRGSAQDQSPSPDNTTQPEGTGLNGTGFQDQGLQDPGFRGAAPGPAAASPEAAAPNEPKDLFSGLDADQAQSDQADMQGPRNQEQQPHLAAPPSAADQKIHELTERVVELQTEVEELKQELHRARELERVVAELQQSVQNLGDATSISRDALGAMSESPQLRGEMAEKLQGKIRLINNTGAPQVIYINGTAWTVIEGRSFIFAPVGTVSFQRPGEPEPAFRGVHEWSANPSDDRFEMTFELPASDTHVTTPRERSVLRRASYPVR